MWEEGRVCVFVYGRTDSLKIGVDKFLLIPVVLDQFRYFLTLTGLLHKRSQVFQMFNKKYTLRKSFVHMTRMRLQTTSGVVRDCSMECYRQWRDPNYRPKELGHDY